MPLRAASRMGPPGGGGSLKFGKVEPAELAPLRRVIGEALAKVVALGGNLLPGLECQSDLGYAPWPQATDQGSDAVFAGSRFVSSLDLNQDFSSRLNGLRNGPLVHLDRYTRGWQPWFLRRGLWSHPRSQAPSINALSPFMSFTTIWRASTSSKPSACRRIRLRLMSSRTVPSWLASSW